MALDEISFSNDSGMKTLDYFHFHYYLFDFLFLQVAHYKMRTNRMYFYCNCEMLEKLHIYKCREM